MMNVLWCFVQRMLCSLTMAYISMLSVEGCIHISFSLYKEQFLLLHRHPNRLSELFCGALCSIFCVL